MVWGVSECVLTVGDGDWPFATRNRDKIAAHWTAASAANDTIFNGEVFVLTAWELSDDRLTGTLAATSFAAYLYWRDCGFPNVATAEAFATTLVTAADGGVLVGRAAAGSLNDGCYVMPGGLLDRQDIGLSGVLDVGSAAARELWEETGLDATMVDQQTGYVIARDAPFFAVSSVFRSKLTGSELLSRVEAFLATQDKPELHDPRLIRHWDETRDMPMPNYVRMLLMDALQSMPLA